MTEGFTRRDSLAALATAMPLAGAAAAPQAPFIRSSHALERLRDVGASVKDTGAVGDGIADDTAAIQEIASYFGRHGGTWRIPGGIYRTTSPIEIDCRTAQSIVGDGSRPVYPGIFDPRIKLGSTIILPVHSGRQAIGFKGYAQGNGSIDINNIAIASLERGSVPVAAFGWDAGNYFLRDFRFTGCSIHGFTSAFDTYRSAGKNNQTGLFRAHYCRINRNRWIARTLDNTQWNGFDFSFNEAGQNGYEQNSGGIDISGHGVSIVANCLEGMRDPIRIRGGYQATDIRSNYFESNIGRALIQLNDIEGPFDIGPNTTLDLDQGKLDHLVLLTNCGNGRSTLPYWPNVTHKLDAAITRRRQGWGSIARNVNDGFLRCDSPNTANLLDKPHYTAIERPGNVGPIEEIHPVTGNILRAEKFLMKQSKKISFDSSIGGRPGEWFVISILSKCNTVENIFDPYISFNVNRVGVRGSRDYVIYRYSEWWQNNEWSLITAAVRLQDITKMVLIEYYPLGINPKSDGEVVFARPVVYTLKSMLDIKPYFPVD